MIMALNNIELLLEKYFNGETTIDEEQQLQEYFSSSSIAPHLKQYQPMFGYFTQSKKLVYSQEVFTKKAKRNYKTIGWSVAASLVLMFGIGIAIQNNSTNEKVVSEYGTCDNPQIALQETQKALDLVSQHLNVGIKSVSYINEYENSKRQILK